MVRNTKPGQGVPITASGNAIKKQLEIGGRNGLVGGAALNGASNSFKVDEPRWWSKYGDKWANPVGK